MLQKCFGHGVFLLIPLRCSVCLDCELSVGGCLSAHSSAPRKISSWKPLNYLTIQIL